MATNQVVVCNTTDSVSEIANMLGHMSLNQIEAVELSPSDQATAFRSASDLHDAWRVEYISVNGNVPRIKKTSDGTSVDINQPFETIHSEMRSFNLRMAEFVMKMEHMFRFKTPISNYRMIHQFWLKMSPYAHGGLLDKPFDDLPPVEQAKDVLVYDTVRKNMLSLKQ